MADEVAQGQVAGTGIAGTLLRDPPTVTVTAPSGPQATSTVTVTWTYQSTLGKPQLSYRVRILNQYGTSTLFDSYAIQGSATSYACPFQLSGGSSYLVRVSCSDGVDTGRGDLAFSADLSEVVFTEEQDVGSVYEVGINGVGLVLADNPQRPYKRSAGQLQAPRLATGSTPFSEAVERYTFVGAGDWSGGAGQRMADREVADPRAFWDSEGVDPFTPGELSLLNTTNTEVASALSNLVAVVASGNLFAQSHADRLVHMPGPGLTQTTLTFTGETLTGLASDGTYWYAATASRKVYRGASTTPGSAWADVSAQTSIGIDVVEWASDRLALAYRNASGQACLSTLSPAGVEETAGGRFKHSDATISAITAGDGYLWYAVNRSDRSVVYAWQLGSTDASFVALELPQGQAVTGLYHYLGNVMIRAAYDVSSTTTQAVIYRAVPSQGELTPERVTALEVEGVDLGPGSFAGMDRLVLFTYRRAGSDGRSGLGALDLSTGGWCRWVAAPGVNTGAVDDVFVWNGKAGFTVGGVGTVVETSTPSASGFVTSSVSDLASGLTKIVDKALLVVEPLPVGGSVDVELSYDDGNTFVSIGSVDATGIKSGEWAVNREARAVVSRLVLAATGAGSPKVRLFQYKLHPLSIVDTLVELPVDCSDRMVGVNGLEIQDAQPVGLGRARFLEDLVGTRVLFQDVDWVTSRQSEVWEVVSAETTSLGTWNRRLGRREETGTVCVVTLRRPQ